MSDKGLQQYRADEINTSDAPKLVLRLYEGAIKFLRQAGQKARQNDVAGRANCLSRANAILFELLRCLDVERGGEIAKNLQALYVFMLRRLLEANLRNDAAMISGCVAILENLHAGWEQAVVKSHSGVRPGERQQVLYSLNA